MDSVQSRLRDDMVKKVRDRGKGKSYEVEEVKMKPEKLKRVKESIKKMHKFLIKLANKKSEDNKYNE